MHRPGSEGAGVSPIAPHNPGHSPSDMDYGCGGNICSVNCSVTVDEKGGYMTCLCRSLMQNNDLWLTFLLDLIVFAGQPHSLRAIVPCPGPFAPKVRILQVVWMQSSHAWVWHGSPVWSGLEKWIWAWHNWACMHTVYMKHNHDTVVSLCLSSSLSAQVAEMVVLI